MRDLNENDIYVLDRIAVSRNCILYMPPNKNNIKYPFFIKKELQKTMFDDINVLCEDLYYYGFSFLPDEENKCIEIIGRTDKIL